MKTQLSVLRRESRRFSDWLSRLLNGTTTDGVRLERLEATNACRTSIISGNRPLPLALGRRQASIHLKLRYLVGLDRTARFLTVMESYIGLSAAADGSEPLMHYDYERDKRNGYPEAHVQVHADSAPWTRLNPERPFAKLHLPTGGRRNRPTLEDILAFLIAERLVDAKPGWQNLVDAGLREYREIQLAASMRSLPTKALTVAHDLQH